MNVQSDLPLAKKETRTADTGMRTDTDTHTLSHVRDFDEAMEQKAVGGVE